LKNPDTWGAAFRIRRRQLLSSTGTESSWRIVCVPQPHPAEDGLAQLQALADELTSESSAPALLIWRSQRALLVTWQDTHLPRFHESLDQMTVFGWPVVLRRSGGGACPVDLGTVQVATVEPALRGTTMDTKYDALTSIVQSSLHSIGIVARTGPVADAYCPGAYDLAVEGKKIAGVSQHWFRNQRGIRCIVTAASINVEEAPDACADAVNRFYSNAGSGTHCQATCLTNLLLCGGATLAVAADPVPAFIRQLDRLRRQPGRHLQRPR
jgi:lipoate-protein ligase A